MTEKQHFVEMFKRIGVSYDEDQGEILTRQHFYDGSLNYVATSYFFDSKGALKAVETSQHGCGICCELSADICENDKTLFLAFEGQEELIRTLKAKKA